MAREAALHHALSSLDGYARFIVGRPLRPYQRAPAAAILDSVLHRRGLTFSVMMSRQAGKNELSAQLQAYLLTRFSRTGGSLVKVAPTFRPQLVTSMLRVQEILDNPLTRGRFATAQGYIVQCGRARAFYFSGGADAQIVGATASLLLEVDEAQDFAEAKYLKDVRPMGASTNVTTVLYGTAWTSDTLLAKLRREHLRLAAQDGIQRHFHYPWGIVAQANADYGRYVEAEIARLGITHPLVRTQYLLEELDRAGRFLSEAQLAQLQGAHPRLHRPERGEVYVAGLDLAGEAKAAEDAALRALEPRKDSTALTIARLTWVDATGVPLPSLQVVDQYWWTGRRHNELFPTLVDLLRTVWGVASLSVDATGVGAGVASFLVGALGADVAHPFTFSAVSKSDLGYQFLAAVIAGRYKLYDDGQGPELSELLAEARAARSALYANQRLQWYVDPRDGHDDLLVSAALTVEAAQHAQPRTALGRLARRDP